VLAHESQARQHNVTFTATTEPVHVVGDRARLRRMCDNVLDNAVKFSTPGSEVNVSVRRDEDSAVLVVADQGIGIPSDELAHVFERLYRATNATDGRYPGAGLGLSIALATVEGHGGTATADNGPDGGAVFTFRLPLHEPAGADG
jgi:signal transduction histidine kinase